MLLNKFNFFSHFAVFDRWLVYFSVLSHCFRKWDDVMGEHKIWGQTGMSNHLTYMLLPIWGRSLSFSQPHFVYPSNGHDNSVLKLL